MPKVYAAGDQLNAVDINEIVKTAGVYAASAAGSDTYAITVVPAPTTYVAGDTYKFKADVINTGAATLNVNALGAKSVFRADGSALATGDIQASSFNQVIYDGTNFRLISHLRSKHTNGTTTRDMTAATGSVNIAHSLGIAPIKVRITALLWTSVTDNQFSFGVFNGVDGNTLYLSNVAGGAAAASGGTGIVNLNIGANSQIATVAVDATNIILSWTKTGTPTGTAQILWEAEA